MASGSVAEGAFAPFLFFLEVRDLSLFLTTERYFSSVLELENIIYIYSYSEAVNKAVFPTSLSF